ncbi:methyl-accepting chemotaxis protein [Janthinobacterium sp. SUN118]|uniref:methyl-accepting chemotaxis protein n=1 Tax=Janthinobacterium sp. SUN118 TaxID=3004100 RepID=UPI0025B00980|nr:methyl-accepting chemotaxis protein [Janthinobacterium sp. SUN118]MDN2709429.1 methyl-accepting chemotaxis protein [Janthinobacterium sp. SUN118]
MNIKTIKGKLAMAFAALALMVLVVSGISIKSLHDANARFDTYLSETNTRLVLVNKFIDAVNNRAIAARNLLLFTKAEALALEAERAKQAHADVGSYLRQLQRSFAQAGGRGDAGLELFKEMERIEAIYGPVALDIVAMASAGQNAAAIQKLNDECQPLLLGLGKATNAYSQYAQARAGEQVAAGTAAFLAQRALLVGVCMAAFCAAAAAGIWIARTLFRALGSEPALLGAAATKVASGDLSRVRGLASPPPDSVMDSLLTMQGALAQMVGQVREASQAISTGSAEIATANTSLSLRTEEQASSLEQTAASMEELTGAVSNTASVARKASELATSASQVACRGADVVSRVVETMTAINAGSQRIADILGTIDGIAFQTNILALNAAVEAARAGEEGRGFAVVASEVRNLAQRSAVAAKEIKVLIDASVASVASGSRLVQDAGVTMGEIVDSVGHVVAMIGEISTAAREQSEGIGQVNVVVSQLDRMTQENAAMVEQTAAAAEQLKEQATQMAALVGTFRLGDERDGAGSAGPALARNPGARRVALGAVGAS